MKSAGQALQMSCEASSLFAWDKASPYLGAIESQIDMAIRNGRFAAEFCFTDVPAPDRIAIGRVLSELGYKVDVFNQPMDDTLVISWLPGCVRGMGE